MAEPDEHELIAAEYALGSLPPEERAEVSARRLSDPKLDRAILAWETQLAPLIETIAPIEPPGGLLQRIEHGLFEGTALPVVDVALQGYTADVIHLSGRVRTWQRVAAGAFGLAAAIALVFGLRETGVLKPLQPAVPTDFVAMLQKDATSPAFVVSVNIATREMTIRPVTAERANGKSYELWLVNKEFAAPRSLGVLGDDRSHATETSLAKYSSEVVKDSVLAVTLEPKGGSPTGNATGPILFTGKLVQLAP